MIRITHLFIFERNFPFSELGVWLGWVSLLGVILLDGNFLGVTFLDSLLGLLILFNLLVENLYSIFPDDSENCHEYYQKFSPKFELLIQSFISWNSMQTAQAVDKWYHKCIWVRHKCKHNRFCNDCLVKAWNGDWEKRTGGRWLIRWFRALQSKARNSE